MRWAQVIDGTIRNRILWSGEGEPPLPGLVPESEALGLPDRWSDLTDEALRAQIVAQVKDEARQHILAVLPEWRQANMTARAVELAEIREAREMTAEETAQHQALQAAWAWVRAVRSASDQIEADVAEMTRPALLAWTMPALP